MTDQAANLRNRMNHDSSKKIARTIAVVSGKGGVGKSNIALNFAITLSKKGKKVLLFDLDVGMGNIDILMGLTPKYSIINMFDEKMSIYGIIESGPYDLSYIAGGSGSNNIFHLNQDKLNYFLTELQTLFQDYDYIFFDMGAGVTQESIHYILAVDECMVVTTPEPTSLTDAYAMIKHITYQQHDMSFHLIINRAISKKNGIQTMSRFKNVVKRFLSIQINELGILPDDRAVTESVFAQKPFIIHKPKSASSKALEELVDVYIGNSTHLTHSSKPSFLKTLKRLLAER